MEPEFISQTAEPMTAENRQEWWRAEVANAETKGAMFHRFCVDPQTGLVLYEGWKVRPEDQGDPRFSFTAETSHKAEPQ